MTPVIVLPESVLSEDADAAGRMDWPEMPALSTLLRGASPLPPTADWRDGVLSTMGWRDPQAAKPAVLAARVVDGLADGTGVCLAAPVHAAAGINRVFLGDGPGTSADADEREAFRAAFNREFGAPGVQLHTVGGGWLLQAPFACAADDDSPLQLAGRPLSREPARDDATRNLRRLGAEVEMWLSDHPLNQLRAQRAMPPINAFWFWDGAAVGALTAPQRSPDCFVCNAEPDPWLTGLAKHCSAPLLTAGHWSEVRNYRSPLVILLPEARSLLLRDMIAWDGDWLEPVRCDLESGHLTGLRLQIGGRARQLPASLLRRWLSRRRPWWQQLP